MAEDKKDQLGKKDQLALRRSIDKLAKAIAALQTQLKSKKPAKPKRKRSRSN
jgi:hypothetical protein